MDFNYRCIDSSGTKSKGSIPAADIAGAKAVLRERGLTVIEVTAKQPITRKRFKLKQGIKDVDIYNMSREMSILLKSGIKIDKAFEILINSVSNMQLKENISTILKDVKAGKTVAQAFIDIKMFNSLTTTMIYAGEGAGNIRSAFENIAEHMKFQIQFKGEIRSALTYPLFLIFASLLTLFVMFKFILPRFFSIFGQNQGMSLPITAKVLYTISASLNLKTLCLFAVIMFGVIIFIRLRMAKAKEIFAQIYSSGTFLIPTLRKLTLHLEMSRFSYSMYSMLNSGIEFIRALQLSTGVIQHRQVRNAIEPAINQIKEGKGIANVFAQINMLPEIVPNMLRVGEESGNLKEIFSELHEIFDEMFKSRVKKILVLVEPAVIVITGIIVGFIVISLILTVMSVSSIQL